MGSSAEQDGRSFAADPIIKCPGKLPPPWQEQLVSCVVDENVGLPDAATLTFRDPNHELLTATPITIGTALTVSMSTAGGGTPEKLFAGEVTALELDSDGTGSFTVVRAMNKAHRLLRGRKVVAYKNMKADAIVKKVATAAGLTVGEVRAKPITYTQLAQPNISDWDFLQNLAQEHGVTVRVDETGKLDFAPLAPAASAPAPSTSAAKSPFVLEYGRNLMALRAVLTSTDQVGKVEVRGWDVQAKKPVVAEQTVARSGTTVPGMTPAEAIKDFGKKSSTTVTDTAYGTRAEADALAESLSAATSAGLGEVEAVVEGDPKLRAGVPVALGNAGDKFSGKYTATAVHHVIEPGLGYRTTVQVSTSPDRSLAGLTTGANAPDRGPRIPGVVNAIVTDVSEPAGGGRGWVKLTFPWLDAKYVSDWARSVQLGGQGGGVISPSVNDEVLVAFEQGCLDKPYVLGGLYNGKDKPSEHDIPLIERGKVARRSLVSRDGHRLELIDSKKGPPGVRIASGDDRLEIRLDEKARTIEIAVKRPGGRGSLSSITLDDGGITLDAGTGEVKVKGRNINLDATADARISALQNASLKGSLSADIDGGGTAALHAMLVRIN
ncbi:MULTISPECIES: VgrG-related protein [unclassified Saccharopolyspora]|uniref:VgrG-related protein n=1 Tax=unclassified Saccharopolyspora TaxID=2646250 RepID=UPI001CD792CC|nr:MULTISPECIES: VgrG-related protein [unclassified Saccharopolyspora]MCA1190285.1 VgrG-related protein [Saccharopolyspora sp. 6T]MCA1195153.1 VgrG-related protein [Saccharopolyspora sp. 6V]MCA1229803.1 VgrG-related protein [Saccharopolyspora sp. 6M]MCA1281489.1 VgrG-related protein [Saccharopolyspora sp. 7B]